jgi:putative ABC transport system permease protein
LGATRSRLVFQLLAESIVLALLGGAVGLAIAVFAVEATKKFGAQDLPRFQETTVDGLSLLFLFGISLGTALLFGLLPAWTTSKADLTSSLKEDGDHRGTMGPTRRRGQAWLVGGQVALACLLLMGAGLLTRSFQALQSVPLGFEPGNIVTADIFLSSDKYVDQRQCQAFFDTLLEKIRQLPGISAIAINDNLPFKVQTEAGFGVSGEAEPGSEKDVPFLTPQVVSSDYFRLMKIPLVRGRSFDENDQAGRQKVAIINESIAKRFFPGRDPIGEQIHDRHENRGLPRNYYTIVGVVRDSLHENPESASVPFQAYYPYTQGPIGSTVVNSATLLLEVAGDAKLTTASIRRVLATIDPDVPLSNVSSLGAVVGKTFLLRQVAMMVVNVFSGVALFLASIGLYAILAYAVARRKREFGIRLALGAPSTNILSLIIRHGAKVVGIGLVIGTLAALVLFQFLGSLLYGVSATDPLALTFSLVLLSTTCFVACLLPALRAIRINPIKALRE